MRVGGRCLSCWGSWSWYSCTAARPGNVIIDDRLFDPPPAGDPDPNLDPWPDPITINDNVIDVEITWTRGPHRRHIVIMSSYRHAHLPASCTKVCSVPAHFGTFSPDGPPRSLTRRLRAASLWILLGARAPPFPIPTNHPEGGHRDSAANRTTRRGLYATYSWATLTTLNAKSGQHIEPPAPSVPIRSQTRRPQKA